MPVGVSRARYTMGSEHPKKEKDLNSDVIIKLQQKQVC